MTYVIDSYAIGHDFGKPIKLPAKFGDFLCKKIVSWEVLKVWWKLVGRMQDAPSVNTTGGCCYPHQLPADRHRHHHMMIIYDDRHHMMTMIFLDQN